MTNWIRYLGVHTLDMIPDGEEGFHFEDAPDPTNLTVGNAEGDIVRCPCHALVTWLKTGVPIVWHRSVT